MLIVPLDSRKTKYSVIKTKWEFKCVFFPNILLFVCLYVRCGVFVFFVRFLTCTLIVCVCWYFLVFENYSQKHKWAKKAIKRKNDKTNIERTQKTETNKKLTKGS